MDKELVERTLAGDSAAFATLVERYRDAAYGIALHVLGETDEATLASQDAFFRAYRGLPGLREPSRFGPWLCRIVKNVARNRLTSKGTKPVAVPLEDVDEPPDGRASPFESAQKSETARFIRELMRKLPNEQRLTFTLYYINGYSERDLSRMLGVPLGTVKSRLNHARSRLKKEVVKMADEVLKGSKPDAEFWRSATALVSGRVSNALTGAAIQGAKIKLYAPQTVTFADARSGPDGLWEVRGVVPGAYSISASHPEFVSQTYRGDVWGRVHVSAIVRPGQAVRGIDFRLEPGARIRGQVVGEDGAPVHGAEITLWRRKERTEEVCFEPARAPAPTNMEGRFESGPLPEDSYVIGVQTGQKDDWGYLCPNCYYPGTLSLHEAEWVKASAKGATPEAVIRLTKKGTAKLLVHVVEAETGKPIQKARVVVSRRDALWDLFAGFTDEAGWFRSECLTLGPFQVTADATDQGFARWSKWIDVATTDKQVEVKFQLPRGALFEGQVVTQDGLELPDLDYFWCCLHPAVPERIEGRSPRRTGISGSWGSCHMALREGPQPEWIRQRPHGRFLAPPVSPGKVEIVVGFPDRDWRVTGISIAGKTLRSGESYECTPGERVGDLKIILGGNLGVVAGRVVSAASQTPMEGAWVHLRRRDKEHFFALPIETDRTGSFLFQSIPSGPYTLAVARSREKPVEESSKREISLEPGSVAHIDLVLGGC